MNRLIKPPLFEKIKNYLNTADKNKQIFLFVPYIKTDTLEKLIDGLQNKIIIVTDWSKHNLKNTSTDLKLYPFCKSHGISLYNNENIHLKIYSINLESMILATGNISERGLMPNGNIELATLISEITPDDRLFFEKIRYESTLITDEIFTELEKWLELNPPQLPKKEPFPELSKKEFMIDALPMTRDVKTLQRAYDRINSGLKPSDDKEITDCVYHDLANYEIASNLSQKEFLETLSDHFFAHPFIQRIDQFLKPCGQFGAIKEWIQDNCTDVPIPSRRELTGNVQVLLEWFVKLGDGKYEMDVPGAHSQRLCKIIPEEVYKWVKPNFTQYHKVVIRILSEPGFSINEIEQKIGKSVHKPNDVNEENNRDKSIWHYKKELDQKVIEYLDLPYPVTSQVHKGGRNKLEIDTARIIEKLKEDERLIVWYNTGSEGRGGTGDGIWRLKEITPIVSQENPISQFKIGQFYHHDEIWKPLNLGWAGGIRASAKNKIVILFWNAPSPDPQRDRDDEFARVNIYEDHFDSKTGLYHYIGEGQVGDQKLESGSGGNKRIVKAKEIGRTIHLFHQHEYDGKHEYLGEVELVETQTTRQNDIDGNDREVFVFLLKPVEKQPLEKQSVQNTVQKNDLDAKLVLFSVSSDAAFEHYQSSLLEDVNTSNFPSSEMKKLPHVRMWGAIDRSGNNNRSKWSKLKKGDILLFFRDKKYVAKMILEGTEDNYEIAKMIWGEKTDHVEMNTKPISGETWQLIMYAKPENITKIDLEDSDLNQLLGYQANFPGPLRAFDFMVVSNEKLKKLQKQYGSIQKALESIGI